MSDPLEGVRVIALARPGYRNALNLALLEQLTTALRQADVEPDVRAVILTGEGDAFCAGLDLAALADGALSLAAVEDDLLSPWRALQAMATPVIGAVNGPAITGGLELALHCDFLLGSDRAVFADTHARVGALPGAGLTVLLPQAVGMRAAREMSYTGRFVDADEALAMGLLNRVVEHGRLMTEASAVAADIVEADRRCLAALKQLYDEEARRNTMPGLEREQSRFTQWRLDPMDVQRRRRLIVERGRRFVAAEGGWPQDSSSRKGNNASA